MPSLTSKIMGIPNGSLTVTLLVAFLVVAFARSLPSLLVCPSMRSASPPLPCSVCIHETLYSGRKPCPFMALIRQTQRMFKTYGKTELMAHNPDTRASLWPIVQLPTYTIINTSSRLIVNTLISVPLNRQIGCMLKTFGKTRKTKKV